MSARRLAGFVVLAAITAVTPAGTPAPGGFGLAPAPTAAGLTRPYFQFTVAPGGSARDSAIVTNVGTATLRLRIRTVLGVTATNSGSAFITPTGRCADASCWVAGLPRTVTLGPHARTALPFQVSVPAGTAPGQYLAGLAAEAAARPHRVALGSPRRASAGAVIVDQVDVGIAVTVGVRARLKTALVITAVTGGAVGRAPRLYVRVHNPGQTFTKARGTVTCPTADRRRQYRVIMETVLPGGSAVLPVNAPGLDSGPVLCRVRLHDGTIGTVTWSGVVSLPTRGPTVILRTGRGTYATVPVDQTPAWAVVLMVLGLLILTALLAVLLRLRRPPRRREPRRWRVAR